MSAVASRSPIPFHSLAEKGLLWHGDMRVPLSALDARLSADVYSAYLNKQSKLYVYPIPCRVLPSVIVATLLINTFEKCRDPERVPRVLFYTGVDGRDLYRDLGIGLQREQISETFKITRLNSDGLPIEPVKLTSRLPLVVTCHCVLPKDQGYRPDIVVIDADAFEARKLSGLIESAANRWGHARFYVVSSNPISPVVGISSKLGWGLKDLLRARDAVNGQATNDIEFQNVSAQLRQLHDGVKYRTEIVANEPSAYWNDLHDSLSIARKHRRASRVARQFLAVTRLLTEMAVLPSEYDAYRTPNMLTIAERLRIIRDEARHEGRTAQLIAGGCAVLSDVCTDLQKQNWKRDALLESVLDFCYSGKTATVLVERAGMRAVLSQAVQLFPECMDMLNEGRLKVIAAADVSRASSCDAVIVPGILSMSDMWVLRTTIAPQMLFLCYSIEASLQSWCLKEIGVLDARDALLAGRQEEADAASSEEPQGNIFNLDLNDLLLSDDASTEEAATTPTQVVSGPRRQLWFDDGTCSIVPDSAALHVIVDTDEPLQSKRAKSIEPGDWVVIVNGDAQQSLFEALREHVDSKTGLSQAIDVVKAFQHALRTAYDASGETAENLHAMLVRLGSDIQYSVSVMQWVDGTRFGPSDPKDISRLGKSLGIPLFENRYADFYRAMQRVRVAHRELGRVLVRVIKNAYRETDSKSVRITVDGEAVVLYDVLQAVDLKRVQQVKELK